MRYELEIESNFDSNLLFWMVLFVKSKLNSLSNRLVSEPQKLEQIMQELSNPINSINELHTLSKNARNAGLMGVQVYMNPLKKLYQFLTKKRFSSLKQIDEEVIKEFLSIHTSSLSDASKKNYRVAMLNFFGYIDKQNEKEDGSSYKFKMELKSWGGLALGVRGQKLPEYMKEEEIERFLQTLETYPFKDTLKARNRLIIKMIIFTGIRVSEALYLKRKDISKDGDIYTLRIRGKGNKYRVVAIKADNIEKELKEILSFNSCQNDLVFCNNKKSALTQAYVSRMVEKILLSAGIRKEKNGAHMLRHTFATLLYLKRGDLLLVQEALGHADLNTSKIYTHFDKDRLKQTAFLYDDLK